MTTTDTTEARRRAKELRSACHGSEARAFDELIATIRNRLEFSGASWSPEAVEQIIDGYDAFVVREFAARGAALTALTAERDAAQASMKDQAAYYKTCVHERDAAITLYKEAHASAVMLKKQRDEAHEKLKRSSYEAKIRLLRASEEDRDVALRDLSAVRAREEEATQLISDCLFVALRALGDDPELLRRARAFLAQHATPCGEPCMFCRGETLGTCVLTKGHPDFADGEPNGKICRCADHVAATPAPVREAPARGESTYTPTAEQLHGARLDVHADPTLVDALHCGQKFVNSAGLPFHSLRCNQEVVSRILTAVAATPAEPRGPRVPQCLLCDVAQCPSPCSRCPDPDRWKARRREILLGATEAP